jgi:hypothetical protein
MRNVLLRWVKSMVKKIAKGMVFVDFPNSIPKKAGTSCE